MASDSIINSPNQESEGFMPRKMKALPALYAICSGLLWANETDGFRGHGSSINHRTFSISANFKPDKGRAFGMSTKQVEAVPKNNGSKRREYDNDPTKAVVSHFFHYLIIWWNVWSLIFDFLLCQLTDRPPLASNSLTTDCTTETRGETTERYTRNGAPLGTVLRGVARWGEWNKRCRSHQ